MQIFVHAKFQPNLFSHSWENAVKTPSKRRPFSTGFIHPELDWMYKLHRIRILYTEKKKERVVTKVRQTRHAECQLVYWVKYGEIMRRSVLRIRQSSKYQLKPCRMLLMDNPCVLLHFPCFPLCKHNRCWGMSRNGVIFPPSQYPNQGAVLNCQMYEVGATCWWVLTLLFQEQ